MPRLGSEGDAPSGIESSPNEPRVGDLFNRAILLVKRSGAFSSITIISGQESIPATTEVDVWLSEKIKPPRRKVSFVEALDAFDDFAFAMEPQVIVSVHLIRESDINASQLRQTLRSQAQDQRQLVMLDETF